MQTKSLKNPFQSQLMYQPFLNLEQDEHNKENFKISKDSIKILMLKNE